MLNTEPAIVLRLCEARSRPTSPKLARMALLSIALGAAAHTGEAQTNSCDTIEFPGAVPGTTMAFGINDAGDVVGAYTFQYGPTEGDRHQYGFLFSGGQFSTIDVPGSQLTVAYGINNAGQIVGSYNRIGQNEPSHGFLLSGGGFGTIDFPGAFFTEAFGINDAGAIVGQFGPDSNVDPGFYRGYLLSQGGFTTIDFPDSMGQTVAVGINAGGVVSGWAAVGRGFRWINGLLTPIDYPGASVTLAYGINDAGAMVGFYRAQNPFSSGFVRSGSGQFTSFDCPGEIGTIAYGINNHGTIVGTFMIGQGPYVRSFVTTPPSIEVLSRTTRWKPQRGDQSIEVHFEGPGDLESGTLEIKDPDGTPVTVNPPPALERLTTTAPFKYRLVWSGPWTRNNPDTGQPERLPAGNYTVVVKATRADNAGELESEPYGKVSLVEVKKIELAQCGSISGVTCQDGGAILTSNQGSGGTPMPGGGKAAFPDAPQPGGDFRRAVLMKAELEPDLGPDAAQVTVYFRFIDVDDPSASTAPIDDDGVATTSTDNRNETATIVPSVNASPDQDGAAIGYFRVSTQQGNNYRLAASTSEAWLNGISGVVSSQSGEVTHASGETLTEGVQVSEMLTVWRIVHLELAELDPSPRTQADLQYDGTWTNLDRRRLDDASAPFFSITLDGLLDHVTRNGWKGADVNPLASAGQDFRVERNNDRRLSTGSGNMCSVVPAGFCRTPPPNPGDRSYSLRDDLLSSLVGTAQDVSLLKSILDSVYISVDPVPGPALPWTRNLTLADHGQIQGTLPNSAPYWSVLFALGFDPETAADYDPTDDGSNRPRPPVVGRCVPRSSEPVAVAFLETIRDYIDTASASCIRPTVAFDEFYRGTTAHEVLHALSLGHDGDTTGGIMCSAIKIFASQPNRNAVTQKQRARLRDLVQPGVFPPVPDVAACTMVSCP